MLDVKDIPICPVPDCQCCAMTARLMEAMGACAPLPDEDAALRLVSLSHAMARTLYAWSRANGDDPGKADIIPQLEFAAKTTASAYDRLIENDVPVH